jgi:hypothetical protein
MPSVEGILWIVVILLGVFIAYRIMHGTEVQKLQRAESYMMLAMGALLIAGIVLALAATFGWSIFPY